MKLNKTDVLVLGLLAKGPDKTRTLSDKTGISMSRMSAILSALVEGELLEKDGWHYRFSKSPQATAVHTLFKKYPSLSAEKLLSETELNVLRALLKRQTVREMAEKTGKTERTVYKKLESFKQMGLIADLGAGTYTLCKTGPIYEDLLPLLEDKIQIKPTLFDDPYSWVAWSGDNELILKTRNPKNTKEKIKQKGWSWTYTSESALQHYGINLIPTETTLHIHKNKEEKEYAQIEDVINHLLLENNEKATEYSKWLILLHKNKINTKKLQQKAKKHNTTKKTQSLLYDLKPIIQT